MKILLWVLVAFAIVMWLTYGKKQRVKAAHDNPQPSTPGAPETMVRCAHCGTYIPASEAVSLPSGMQFCSEEHRLQHSASGTSA
ncbi:PP0621 family protein [Noviherbaspirillum sp. ST9]|uniref:PP0621 family protein n=1 Tax=Noviherbaspirillum sp. ST9 TaxID=3401606 RepID=UPI003B586D62